MEISLKKIIKNFNKNTLVITMKNKHLKMQNLIDGKFNKMSAMITMKWWNSFDTFRFFLI